MSNNQSIETLKKQISEIKLPNMERQHENAKRNYPELINELLSIKKRNKLYEFFDKVLINGTKEEKVALRNILNGIRIKRTESTKNKEIYGLIEIVKLNLNRQTRTYTNNSRSKKPKSRKTRKNRK